jgi:hypothetical protein
VQTQVYMEGGNWGQPTCKDKGAGVGTPAQKLHKHCPSAKQCTKEEEPVGRTACVNPILEAHIAVRGCIRKCVGAS